MAIAAHETIKSYEEFKDALYQCCDTLIRNSAPLYELLRDACCKAEVTFTFEPGCVVTMDTKVSNLVHKNEENFNN